MEKTQGCPGSSTGTTCGQVESGLKPMTKAFVAERRSTALALWLWCLGSFATAAEPPENLPPIKIALIGDSTVSTYKNPPADRPTLTGWGQVFDLFFHDAVEIKNHAVSGRSSKSFLAEGRWPPVLAEKPDYIFIQFGHNDQ